MGASIHIRNGTGHQCWICNKPIKKDEPQINFRGYNAGAIIHSDANQCNKMRRLHVPKQEVIECKANIQLKELS